MSNAYRADTDLLTAADDGMRWRTQAIILHTSESAPTADDLARYSQNLDNEASYHLIIDRAGRVVRSNDDPFAPWAAGYTGNHIGIHICLTGYASQTRDEWLAQRAQLDRAADVIAAYTRTYAIPHEYIDATALRNGARGVCGHGEVSAAWKEVDHWDPGPDFPFDYVLNPPHNTPQEVPDMTEEDRRMLRELHAAVLGPRPSFVDDTKHFDLPTNVQLVDAATYRNRQDIKAMRDDIESLIDRDTDA